MGFTPLEGLMMGTRSGDIDPALVTYLMRKENMDAKSMEAFLNKKCGLLAVSKISADTREVAAANLPQFQAAGGVTKHRQGKQNDGFAASASTT